MPDPTPDAPEVQTMSEQDKYAPPCRFCGNRRVEHVANGMCPDGCGHEYTPSAPRDGGPAFPLSRGTEVVHDWQPGYGEFSRTVNASWIGITIRDYFAAKAMQAMFNGYAASGDRAPDVYFVCAREAYAVADAMLAARKAGGQ